MNRLSQAIVFLLELLGYHKDGGGSLLDSSMEDRRRRRRILVFSLTALFLGLVAVELLFQSPQVKIPIANNLLILFLLNISIILLLVMAVLLGRYLVKLYFESRGKAFKPRFQTKLVLSFLMLISIPAALLFIVASGLITNSIENWFNITVEKSLKDSLAIAERLYRQSEEQTSTQARRLAEIIAEKRMMDDENRVYLQNTVKKHLNEYGSEGAAIFSSDFKEIAREGLKEGTPVHPDRLDDPRRQKLTGGETISEIITNNNRVQVLSIVPIFTMSGRFSGAVALINTIDPQLLNKINSITNTFDEYKQLKLQKFPIKAVYEITLLLVTLVILFASIWYGFYLARDITGPIHELADATQKVSDGDLSVRLEVKSNDEIGFLVNSFNKMTEELETSRARLESGHKELVEINLELDRRRKYIETILAKIATGVISIDNRGRITTCNPAATSILKLKTDEQYGKYYEEIFEPIHLDPIRNILREMGENEKDSIEKHIQLTIDGVQRTLLLHVSTLRDARKQFMGVAVVFDDLTALINAQKTAAWREIAQHIAHEIKNPLTPIRLNAERLRMKYHKDRETFNEIFDNSTKVIIQEVEVLQSLINEFSRFAQLPEPKPSKTPLHDVITEVINLYRGLKPEVNILTKFDPSIGLVMLDRGQMHRAMRNLLENAIDAVGTKGTIEITTFRDIKGKRVHINITDDGPGIDVKNQDKVFLPYFSTKKKGSGLGLAIVNRIVADHEGNIRVKNHTPHGTIMTIDLPAA